jgi:predicted nucleic acid-binding protein
VEGLTLDTSALVALERAVRAPSTPRVVAIVEAIADPSRCVTVPSVVAGEWWRGQRGPAAALLDTVAVEPLSRSLAEAAGLLLARVKRAERRERERLLLVDAIVVVSAARRGDVIYSSDVDDLERLRDLGHYDVRILRV